MKYLWYVSNNGWIIVLDNKHKHLLWQTSECCQVHKYTINGPPRRYGSLV